jgi:hypothetical protein
MPVNEQINKKFVPVKDSNGGREAVVYQIYPRMIVT